MCKENEVKVIECNLRASRSCPFISKTFNANFIEIATKVMLGMPQKAVDIKMLDMDFVACKVPVFSFTRLKNSDPRLGVEMQSTGEVACFGRNQYEAYLKGLCSTHFRLPTKTIFVSIGPFDEKVEFLKSAIRMQEMGFQLYASKNTAEFLKERNVTSYLYQNKIDLVINSP